VTDPELSTLLAQEQRLVFADFDLDTAWELGCFLRDAAAAGGLPVALDIRRSGRQLFHAALPGSSADNDGWLARKTAVVERYGHSSYFVGCQFRADGKDFDVDSRLDPARFAAHGGAFPLTVAGAGVIGSVAVSGLPQIEDHEFVVTSLDAFLTRRGDLTAT
jgi:uncharacterized protein (UPF0303 family)